MIKQFYRHFFKTWLFWMVFFAIHRFFFILFNIKYATEGSTSLLFLSFIHGLRLDLSFSGYVMMLTMVMQLISLAIRQKFCFKCIDYFTRFFIVIFTAVLLADTNLYSYWSRHMSTDAIAFLATPKVIFYSLHWYDVIIYIIAIIAISGGLIVLYNRLIGKRKENAKKIKSISQFTLIYLLALLTAGLIILPIRGGLGVAPINTGVAYFSQDYYANSAALNPLWQLVYALKDSKSTQREYRFMEDEKATAIFDSMMTESGEYPKLLKKEKPNVVFLLLESFAAQNIKALGGHDITPQFNKLVHEGVLFSNIYAASTRSDKGLVATLAGYQVLPSYSIIRYPEKTQELSFFPKAIQEAGYNDLMYMYGGDIKFKNMDSFVKQAGFEKVITINDFPTEQKGEKWGVHDEFTFEKLTDEMVNSTSPYLKFLFTLSSHEPFDVPMERHFENDYQNSIFYLDSCLGKFIADTKLNGQWDNTLFILMADHGTGGFDLINNVEKQFHHIPMLWLGGALAATDTVIETLGSQTDLARTLLCQLGIDNKAFRFSKNLLDKNVHEFAFFDFPDAMGLIKKDSYQLYDNQLKRFVKMEGTVSAEDSIKAKAYLQVISLDHKQR